MKAPKLPSNLVATACLSAGLTIVFSLLYIALCIMALIYRYNCDVDENVNAANYFWNTLYHVYIQDAKCTDAEEYLTTRIITSSHRVFIFLIITLCASVITFSTAVVLISITRSKKAHDRINLVINCYVVVCISSLIIDVIFAVHFGADYSVSQSDLESLPVSDSNYETEIHRIGALILMTIALKGYIAPIINIVLVIMLLVFTADFQKILAKSNHSIHVQGLLRGYDSLIRDEEGRQKSGIYNIPIARSAMPTTNPVFIDEMPLTPMVSTSQTNLNTTNDLADSWGKKQLGQSWLRERPFSYLDGKPTPLKVKSTADPWRRDWSLGPPVPAPDYSPVQTRRLKSALKP